MKKKNQSRGIILALVATALLVCCRGPRVKEDFDAYEEGYVLNDTIRAFRDSDGRISFKNIATGKTTIRDVHVQWTSPAPNDSLAVFCSGGKRGYYNIYSAEIVVQPVFTKAWWFSEGLAAVLRNGMIGFIDRSGSVAIDFNFPYRGNPLTEFVFHDGHCVVANEQGRCGVIDKWGNWLIPPEWKTVIATPDYAVVSREGETMQVGYDGTIMNPCVLDCISDLSYEVSESHVTGDGEIVQMDRAIPTGLYAYSTGGRWGLLDLKTGEKITLPLYESIYALSENRFVAYLLDGMSKVILDRKGEIINLR